MFLPELKCNFSTVQKVEYGRDLELPYPHRVHSHAFPHTFIHTAPRMGQRLLKVLEIQRQMIWKLLVLRAFCIRVPQRNKTNRMCVCCVCVFD